MSKPSKPPRAIVKEKASSSASKGEGLADLFRRTHRPPARVAAELDPIRVQETVLTPSDPQMLKAQGQERVASTRQNQPKRLNRKESQTTGIRTFVLLFFLLLLTYGAIQLSSPGNLQESSEGAQATSAQIEPIDQRILFHRNETGRKLNRERIGVEFEARTNTLPLSPGQKPPPVPDMMAGAPLGHEGFHRGSSRDRLEPANPDYSDNRIGYTLQEQQAANDWERRAQKQYIDEFVANANKAGYKIKVDKDGTVSVLGYNPPSRLPAAPSGPTGTGSVR